jgi:small subunit ribosomal protein S17
MPKRILTGVVVSDKIDKTVVVLVSRSVKHGVTGKRIKRSKKYKADDRENACRMHDVVKIIEANPISKDKRWSVLEIVKRDVLDEVDTEVIAAEGGDVQ